MAKSPHMRRAVRGLMPKNFMKALLIGFGNVGRTLVEILSDGGQYCKLKDLNVSIIGIITKNHGSLVNSRGIDLIGALSEFEKGNFAAANPDRCDLDALNAVKELEYDVMIETSPLSIEGKGEPAVTYVREALSRNCNVITANKGPMAFAYSELMAIAKDKGVLLLHEATVMDGTPLFNMARHCLRGTRVTSLEGILNSTSNYVLSMMESGMSMDQAISQAQKMGIAEKNPMYDLEGWDSTVKLCVLVNALCNAKITPFEVDRNGITDITSDQVQNALRAGKHLKLICKAKLDESSPRAEVKVTEVEARDIFSTVKGQGAMLKIYTDIMAPFVVSQTDPTLPDTAYGIINDLFEVKDHISLHTNKAG